MATLKRFGPILAYAGLLILLLALITYIVAQQLETSGQVLLVAGAVLLVAYLVIESGRVRSAVTGRGARYGTNTALMILAFVGILVMVNALSNRHHWRWDVTSSKQFSISEQTVNVLKGLTEPVKVIGFFSTANPYQAESQLQLENLLKSYQLHTDKLSFEFIDPDAKPGVARQYEIASYGTVVFERGNKRQQTMTVDEQSLTSTLLKVSHDEVKGVYFLSGHKERDPEATTEEGYSEVKNHLEKNNYKVGTVNFTITDVVPSDMNVLVIAAPLSPLADKEVEIIDKYLANGGKALVMAEAGVTDTVSPVLNDWGIATGDDLIIDPASGFFGDPTTPVVTGYGFPEVTKGVSGLMTFYPTARSLEKMDDVTTTLTVSPILNSSTAAWAEIDYRGGGQVQADEGKDTLGPVPFAMAATSSVSNTRIVAVGDSDFAANGALRSVKGFGNLDMLAGAVNWLAEEEALVSIAPKAPDQRILMMPPGSSRLVTFSSLVLLPLVVIVAGVVVWWNRR